MILELHSVLLYAIAAVAAVVWLCGLMFLLATTRRRSASPTWADEDEALYEPGHITVHGCAEVAGAPAELAAKAAGHLAQHGAVNLGPVKILEQTDGRVIFEAMPHLGGRFIRRGVLEFHGQPSGRTQIDYAVLIPKRGGLLLAAWIFQILGLIALVVGFSLLHALVVPHPNPNVQWQSVQMAQVVHFLWPPFLFAGLYRRVQSHVRNTFDSLVHNLPYLQS
ncbi:MAG: hypothetical protein L0Y71_24330 [Gemmataceae bacterium]|nr:hypothetical protein [Gemmataceae bacterium]